MYNRDCEILEMIPIKESRPKPQIIYFAEIRESFEKVWKNGREVFWYYKAWECLYNKKLTPFSSREEHCLVLIRALTINMIYREFCELEFDEPYQYKSFNELLGEPISDFELGQLFSKFTDNNFIDYGSFNKNEVLRLLAESQRRTVFDAMKEELGVDSIYLGMLFTGPFENANIEACTYEEYCSSIVSDLDDFYIDEYSEAYCWLIES